MTTATITRTTEPYPGETRPLTLWAVEVDGRRIATLYIDPDTAEIANVETDEAHRGQGHATALYRAAAAAGPIFHAPETHRSAEGAAWAARVGGPSLPPCTDCCAFLYEYETE